MPSTKNNKLPLFGVVDRYLVREVGVTVAGVSGILLLILLSNRLVRFLADVAAGRLPGEVVISLLSLKSIEYVAVLLPMAFYLAVLLVMGRLYRDNEMTVLAACGVGSPRLLRPIFLFALFFCGVLLAISLKAAPWAARTVSDIEKEVQRNAEVTGVVAGRFKESTSGERIFYVERLSTDQKEMDNVFIQTRKPQGRYMIQSSDTAHLEFDERSGDRYLVMENGYIYQGAPGAADFRITRFQRHKVRIEESEQPLEGYKRDAMTLEELLVSESPLDRAELQWRISNAVTILVFALLAVPLSRTKPRQGRYGKLFVALMIYLTYVNVLGVARNMVERDVVPLWLGLWWVHLLVMVGVAVLWAHELGGIRRWRASRAGR